MNNLKKYFFAVVIIITMAIYVSAATDVAFEGTTCAINVTYNEDVMPGDAIIVKMIMRSYDKKKATKDTTAVAQLFNEKKRIEAAKFFYTNQKTKRQNVQEMISFVPLSTWLSDGKYSLKVVYSAFGSEAEEFSIPITISKKSFLSETIALNDKNTAIKTDTSPTRIAQIDKLNGILGTINAENVYTLKSFISPVDTNTRRTSQFGDRRVYAYSSGSSSTSLHNGIDYGVPEGTVVLSSADGKVVMAENRISTGFSVVIEHAPGLYSLYYHLSSLNVKEGQSVKQGDKIGLSGSTGLATGPHLHWEVRLNMCAVSPDFFTTNYAYENYN